MDQDKNHIKLLSIFHFVLSGLTAFFSMIPLIHLSIGLMMISGRFNGKNPQNAPPEFVGWILVIVALFMILSGLTMAIMILVAGLNLKKFKKRTFCLVIAGIECLFIPFGTILGIFTIIILMKDSVEKLFKENKGIETE